MHSKNYIKRGRSNVLPMMLLGCLCYVSYFVLQFTSSTYIEKRSFDKIRRSLAYNKNPTNIASKQNPSQAQANKTGQFLNSILDLYETNKNQIYDYFFKLSNNKVVMNQINVLVNQNDETLKALQSKLADFYDDYIYKAKTSDALASDIIDYLYKNINAVNVVGRILKIIFKNDSNLMNVIESGLARYKETFDLLTKTLDSNKAYKVNRIKNTLQKSVYN